MADTSVEQLLRKILELARPCMDGDDSDAANTLVAIGELVEKALDGSTGG